MKFRVLMVEEDADLARQIATELKKAGMECNYTSQTTTGLDLFKREQPHLVLLGLGLPNVGGAAMCGDLRKISNAPIAIVSVRTRREDHLHGLNIGADEFIMVRPFDQQLLMARIFALMRRSYQYDQPRPKETASGGANSLPGPMSSLPEGWVKCESCDYMGPRGRFERMDPQGNAINRCPHCERNQTVRFIIA